MMHLATLLFAFAGFTLLCLAMTKHQPDLIGRRLPDRHNRRVRWLAIALLAATFGCAVTASGWRFGTVEWFGAIMAAPLVVTLLLPYRPRWIVRLAAGSSVTGLVLCAGAPLLA